MRNNAVTLISVTDLTHASQHSETIEPSALAPLLAQWWAPLGIDIASAPVARELCDAVRARNYPLAHRIADYLSLSLSPVVDTVSTWEASQSWLSDARSGLVEVSL